MAEWQMHQLAKLAFEKVMGSIPIAPSEFFYNK